MKKIKFLTKRNVLLGLFGVGFLAAPLVLTSCSQTKKLIENTIFKNDGTKFSSTLSLNQAVTNALKNNTASQKGLLDTVVSELAWQWFNTDIAKDDKSLLDELNRHNRTTNEEYTELVKKYQKENKNDWELLLQQQELDKNGGTEQTLKKNKHLEWASSQLKTKVFNNDFSAILKKDNSNSNVLFKPSKQEIIDALDTTKADYSLGFSEKIIQNYSNADVEYAKFQKFIFDKWVEIENPFVINMALWKYSTPSATGGIAHYYNVPKQESSGDGDNNGGDNSGGSTGGDNSNSSGSPTKSTNTKLSNSTKEGDNNNGSGDNSNGGGSTGGDGGSGGGDTSTTTASGGSYIYPYFSDEKNNTNTNTVGIFKQFLEGAKTNNNFKINGSANSLGLKHIPKKYTEDSSTFILAKNSSIYNDLYIEFAAASSYLYGTTPTTNKLVTEKNIKKTVNLTTSSTLGFDPITNLFVSENQIKTGNASDINETKLSKNLLSQIINPTGPLAKVAEKDLYTIDAFKFENTELNEYMLLRDEAGVHAISIDGSDYIKTGTDKKDVAKKAGDVVLYHSLMNKYYGKDSGGNIAEDVLNVDIKTELNKFFETNMSYLVLEYAKNNNDQKMFNLDDALNKEIASIQKELITSLNIYLFELSKYNIQKDYIKKMYDAKAKYSANYGIDAQKNGLAAMWIYATSTQDASFKGQKINSIYNYDLTKVSAFDYSFNIYDNGSGSRKKYFDEVDKYIGKNELGPQKSNFIGYKYSQYVFSNNIHINGALKAYSSDNTTLTDEMKISAFEKYIGDQLFDFSNLTFKSYTNLTGDNTKLDDAFANYYFSSSFDSESTKWLTYNLTNGFTKDNLKTYKKNLWKESMLTEDSLKRSKYLTLLTALATAKYLIDNEDKFIDYLKTKIAYGVDTYIVWENSQNINLDENKSSTVDDLLKADTKLKQNINNSMNSAYIGSTTNNVDAIDKNNKDSIFNNNAEYYKIVDNKVGYKGIQTSSTNSLSSTISDNLFVNSKQNGNNYVGSLNAFVSKEELFKHIESFSTFASIDGFATNLATKLPNMELSGFNDKKLSLNEKKTKLIDIVKSVFDSNSTLLSDAFTKRNGIVGVPSTNSGATTYSPIADKKDNYLEYGAEVVQLNTSDLKDKNSLMTALKGSTTTNGEVKAKELYYNLLAEASTSNDLQNKVIGIVANSNKITAFDKTVNDQLGATWLTNWKKQ